MFAIDDAMGEVVRTTTEPALGAIRLAWWREALLQLDSAPPPAEPRLQAAFSELLPRGVTGNALGGLDDGWSALLDEFAWSGEGISAIAERGRGLFALGARLLGEVENPPNDAGALFALADAARFCRDRAGAAALVEAARTIAGQRYSKRLRPMTALAALARRDLAAFPDREAEGTPARAVALLCHRITGRA